MHVFNFKRFVSFLLFVCKKVCRVLILALPNMKRSEVLSFGDIAIPTGKNGLGPLLDFNLFSVISRQLKIQQKYAD